METLVLDGKTYVKASKAARDLGYTSDYVGQLCRSGQVSAHLVGRTWYVDQEQLSGHRVEKKRMSRTKAREQAHRSIEEHKKKTIQAAQSSATKLSVRYEGDDSELIPTPRKLTVEAESVKHAAVHASVPAKDEPKYEIENAGEKIVYSGKLKVIDLNEEETAIDKDTVVLTARVNRKKISETTKRRVEEPIIPKYVEDTSDLNNSDESEYQDETDIQEGGQVEVRKDFRARLEAHDVALVGEAEEAGIEEGAIEDVAYTEPEMSLAQPAGSRFSVVFGLLIPLLLAVGSIGIERIWQYMDTSAGVVRTASFNIDFARAVEIIRSKI